MPATGRASKTRTALLAVIIVSWAITFSAVGIGSDGVTGLCIGGAPAPGPVAGYTWARDHANDCAWTLYSNVLLRNGAPDSVYIAEGLTPPEQPPVLHDWQLLMILLTTGFTAMLGLWRARLGDRADETVSLVTAPADAS